MQKVALKTVVHSKIIKSFMSKFDCIQNHIIRFLREYRIQGVENKNCSTGLHMMKIG